CFASRSANPTAPISDCKTVTRRAPNNPRQIFMRGSSEKPRERRRPRLPASSNRSCDEPCRRGPLRSRGLRSRGGSSEKDLAVSKPAAILNSIPTAVTRQRSVKPAASVSPIAVHPQSALLDPFEQTPPDQRAVQREIIDPRATA